MIYCKLVINLFIISLILSFVVADDEKSSTEDVEVILTPGPISGEYKTKDLDASYDESSSVLISCSGTSCTSNGDGDLQGQVYISTTEDDFVHLILNNMSITSNNGPALYEVECDKLVITMVGENSLTDSTNYIVDEDEEPDGCLFAKSDLSFNGEGTLTVTGNYSEEKGIKAKNSVSIKEAVINVESGDTAIKACKDTDPEKGFVVIDGGRIMVKTGKDGIHAETHLTINGGYIDVSESEEGLEGQMIDIKGGEIHVNANDDGINASKIGATNDEFGPGGMGGPGGMVRPGNMNVFNETINIESGNTGDNPSQQPDFTLIPNPSEQTETIIIDYNEESTTQSTIYPVSVETSTTIPLTTIATKTIPSNINNINTGYGQNSQRSSTKNVIPNINSNNNHQNNNNNNNNNNPFGQNNNSFGKQNNSNNNNSFGQNNNSFGKQNNNNNNNPFGQNNNSFGQQNNNLYGKQNNNSFGQNNNSFGQNNNFFGQNNNYFGQNNNFFGQNNNSFGQNNNSFGQNNNSFGQNNNSFGQNNNSFGQNNNSFGQNNNSFGQNNNSFGQNNNSFGQNNNSFGQNNNSFGQQNNNNNNNNPFGQNNNLFGKQNNNSFGQNNSSFSQANKIITTKTIPNIIPTGNVVRVSNTNIQKSNREEQIYQPIKQPVQQPQNQRNIYDSYNKINSNIIRTVYKTTTTTRKNIIPTLSVNREKFDSNYYQNNNSYSQNRNSNGRIGKRGNTANDEQVYIKITGGKLYVKVDGGDVDGIDSNGSLYIGGDSEVYVSNGSGDIYGNMASLDAEGSNIIDNGATVVVTASGMNNGGMGGGPKGQRQGGPNKNGMNKENQTNQDNQINQNKILEMPKDLPSDMLQMNNINNSTQPQLEGYKQNFNQTEFDGPMDGEMKSHGGMGGGPGGMESGSIKQANIQITVNSQEAGSEITVTDSEGNIIISHQPETTYSKILISSPKLVEGATYTIVAGTETQTATASVDSS